MPLLKTLTTTTLPETELWSLLLLILPETVYSWIFKYTFSEGRITQSPKTIVGRWIFYFHIHEYCRILACTWLSYLPLYLSYSIIQFHTHRIVCHTQCIFSRQFYIITVINSIYNICIYSIYKLRMSLKSSFQNNIFIQVSQTFSNSRSNWLPN